MPRRVSLTVIAKNEGTNLRACLSSVADLVDETIVVDTGSTDDTKQIAAGLGARVFDFAWCDSFAAARNESVRHATGDWILWLDGDEHFDDANRAKLQTLLAGLNGQPAGYVMIQRSAPEAAVGSATEVHQVRLFPNHPAVRWSYRVHEQILPGLRRAGHDVRFTDIVLEHTGYQDPALRLKKTERNLRLLHLEEAEQPDDPFTLFNLGWAYQELGQAERALPYLRRSLNRCGPGDSIVRKLYVLLVQAHRELGQGQEAAAALRAGRARHPDDPELLFLEGLLRYQAGDPKGARACAEQVRTLRPGAHFSSIDSGLRGPRALYLLGLIARDQGQADEAESFWRSALAESPQLVPAWLALAELFLVQGRPAELDAMLKCVPAAPLAETEALILRGRTRLACRDFADAGRLFADAVARDPRYLKPRLFLTYALLQDGSDPQAAEQALRDFLALDPAHAESWRNLALLLKGQGKKAEALAVCQAGRAHCPNDPPLLLVHALLVADPIEAEALLLQYLEVAPPAGSDRDRADRASARHRLALIYQPQRRHGEAESQWRAAVAEQPDFLGAWLGLAEICLAQERWTDLDDLDRHIAALPGGELETAVLQARRHQAHHDFPAAHALLDQAITRHPKAVWPRLVRSRVLLQQDRKTDAEQALREVLVLDPRHAEAHHNLSVLRGAGFQPALKISPANRAVGLEAGPEEVADGRAGFQPAPHNETPIPKPAPPLARKSLRIAFACYSPIDFRVHTAYERPLGGSESALCYLAEALADAGHDIFVLNSAAAPAVSRGVACLPLTPASLQDLPAVDVFVVQNLAGRGRELRPILGPKTRLLLWTGHAHDQPAVQDLRHPAERDAYDAIAFVSDWQRQQFIARFDLDPDRTVVLRNGICPAFANLFPEGEEILARKTRPPVLVYTSTPYRGLDLLLDAFPLIRREVPDVTLKVFSSMQVYGPAAHNEDDRFAPLYRRSKETEGVAYIGSVPQPRLATELRSAAILAYPNTFAETSCIAVLEAMAAGCRIVTSARAALPETTAGFATLVAVEDSQTYVPRFVTATVDALRELADTDTAALEDRLRRQVDHVNDRCTWKQLAQQWLEWLRA
jgi:tetratricopeptide (TPR) repeat protein